MALGSWTVFGAVLAALLPASAHAQNPATGSAQAYPTRPVRIVVPYPPGGGNDIIGRIAAEELTRRLGQQALVDNRPGGSTVIGADLVAKAPPDGHTLLVTSHTTFAFIPNLRSKLPFDPVRDFEPISLMATQSFVLVTHPSVPARTIKDMIALARSKPGELTFASSGVGTGTHFSGEQMKVLAGIDIRHIPYKGGGPALNDLIAGHVSMGFGSIASTQPFAKQGKIRMIAITSGKRSAAAPDIPTIGETIKGYEMTPWNAIFAPRGTPKAIIERLNREIVAGIKSPHVAERLTGLGYDAAASTPAELAAHVKLELTRYGKLIKAIGFKDE
ncbi:MAG TPA: tripartite tricarboxylate transporter substrate binding protein [Burkholderiales bacterium]|nr:tripartite tricarboxylate transporter substrate binding protein [Burkholderiales bacterium]